MNNLSNKEKNQVVVNTLCIVDDVNIILETPSYHRKYSDSNFQKPIPENDEDYKRYLVICREKLRKILLTNWYTTNFNKAQIADITNTLSLIRQKISKLFTN